MDVGPVTRAAMQELAAEKFREEVEQEKARLRKRRGWWKKLFPFTITIRRTK